MVKPAPPPPLPFLPLARVTGLSLTTSLSARAPTSALRNRRMIPYPAECKCDSARDLRKVRRPVSPRTKVVRKTG